MHLVVQVQKCESLAIADEDKGGTHPPQRGAAEGTRPSRWWGSATRYGGLERHDMVVAQAIRGP